MEAKLSGQTITVAVVEDEPLLSDLLRVALQQHSGLQVVGVFSHGEPALRHIPRLQPHVALLDIDLGKGFSGIQLGLLLREQLAYPARERLVTPVVALTVVLNNATKAANLRTPSACQNALRPPANRLSK